MSDLARLLLSHTDGDDKPKISHVGQIACLREHLAAYQTPCGFKVGDLVTPRRMANIKGHGEPHIVVEATKHTGFSWQGEPGSSTFGNRRNLRIACFTPFGTIASHWVEHSEMEPFVEAVAAAPKAAEPETANAAA